MDNYGRVCILCTPLIRKSSKMCLKNKTRLIPTIVLISKAFKKVKKPEEGVVKESEGEE